MMEFFRCKPARIKLVPSASHNIAMKDWRESETLVSQLSALSKTPLFEAMMQTLRNESPMHYVTPNAAPHDIIKHLGHIEGYQMALNNIEALASLVKQPEALTATFEPQDEKE